MGDVAPAMAGAASRSALNLQEEGRQGGHGDHREGDCAEGVRCGARDNREKVLLRKREEKELLHGLRRGGTETGVDHRSREGAELNPPAPASSHCDSDPCALRAWGLSF